MSIADLRDTLMAAGRIQASMRAHRMAEDYNQRFQDWYAGLEWARVTGRLEQFLAENPRPSGPGKTIGSYINEYAPGALKCPSPTC